MFRCRILPRFPSAGRNSPLLSRVLVQTLSLALARTRTRPCIPTWSCTQSRSFASYSAPAAIHIHSASASSSFSFDSAPAAAPAFELILGLEVHAQLSSAGKLFSPAKLNFAAPANENCAFFDAAMPGTMPRLNQKCVDLTILTGLALAGSVAASSRFVRKHYYYSDLPVGYQLTQLTRPLIVGGRVELSPSRFIELDRIQLEQDSGKSVHDLISDFSAVDLNRCGAGLMEIVTRPVLRSVSEVRSFVHRLTEILRCLGASKASMEEGSLRIDVNVSVDYYSSARLVYRGSRVELKNMNSLRAIQRSIEFEFARQTALIRAGQPIARETRGFDGRSNSTFILRSKEELLDYRFLIDPDMSELRITEERIKSLKESLPMLPQEKLRLLLVEYSDSLQPAEVATLFDNREMLDYFTAATKAMELQKSSRTREEINEIRKSAFKWIIGDVLGRVNRWRSHGPAAASGDSFVTDSSDHENIENPLSVDEFVLLMGLIHSGRLSAPNGKFLLSKKFSEFGYKKSISELAEEGKLISGEREAEQAERQLEAELDKFESTETVWLNNYFSSQRDNSRVLAGLIGQFIRSTGGKIPPIRVKQRVEQKLEEIKGKFDKQIQCKTNAITSKTKQPNEE